MSKNRITREKKTVELMIRLYCRKKEKNQTLCPSCEELLHYAHARLDRCPFGEKKSSCKRCTDVYKRQDFDIYKVHLIDSYKTIKNLLGYQLKVNKIGNKYHNIQIKEMIVRMNSQSYTDFLSDNCICRIGKGFPIPSTASRPTTSKPLF